MLRIVALLVYVTHLFLAADLGAEAPTSDQGSGWDPSGDQGSGWDPWG
jgi:hypothetical protein